MRRPRRPGRGRATALAAAGDVIVNEDGRLRFTHPLLASLCYERAAPSRRRDAHRRLAEVVNDVEERARHLALARHRARRGGGTRAGRRLRPAPRARRSDRRCRAGRARGRAHAGARGRRDARRRRLDARRLLWLPGICERALGDRRRARCRATPPGPERADLLYVLAVSGGQHVATRVALCEQGIVEAGDDDAPCDRAARAARGLPLVHRGYTGGARRRPRGTSRRAERVGDPRLLVDRPDGRGPRRDMGAADRHRGSSSGQSPRRRRLDVAAALLPEPSGDARSCDSCTAAIRRPDGRSSRTTASGARRAGRSTRTASPYVHLVVAEWLLGRVGQRARARTRWPSATSLLRPTIRATAASAGSSAPWSKPTEVHLDEARVYAESGARQHAASIGDHVATIANEAQLGHIELVAGAYGHRRASPARSAPTACCATATTMASPDMVSGPTTIETLIAVGGTRSRQGLRLDEVRGDRAAGRRDASGCCAARGGVARRRTRRHPTARWPHSRRRLRRMRQRRSHSNGRGRCSRSEPCSVRLGQRRAAR